MKFQAKKDDQESREYWEAVRRGAEVYDAMPDWKKGAPVALRVPEVAGASQSGEEET